MSAVQTFIVQRGRIIALTDLFLSRCDSFLNFLAIKGKIGEWEVIGEEWDVVGYLSLTGQISEAKNSHDEFYFSSALPYRANITGTIDPTVLSLADENPANANFVRVYRKNHAGVSA